MRKNRLELRRRIVHVISSFDTGGTEMMCLRLARYWQNHFDQSIIALDPGSGKLEGEFRGIVGPHVRTLGQAKRCPRLTSTVSLSWLMAKEEADAALLHVFGMHHIRAALAAKAGGVTSVAASAGNAPPLEPLSRRRWAMVLAISRMIGCPVASCSDAVH